MNVQISSIEGPVNKLVIKNKLKEFAEWLHLQSGASPTKDDPLIIKFWDEETSGTSSSIGPYQSAEKNEYYDSSK